MTPRMLERQHPKNTTGGRTEAAAAPTQRVAPREPVEDLVDKRLVIDDASIFRRRDPSVCLSYTAFERTWTRRCPGVMTSLREGGDELLTFFRFPKAQWKALRSTNVIE